MDKYEIMKSHHYDFLLQAYMCAFMYVDPEKIPAEDYFPDTKIFVGNYNKFSTPGPVPKHWI